MGDVNKDDESLAEAFTQLMGPDEDADLLVCARARSVRSLPSVVY